MSNKSEVQNVIFQALTALNQERGADEQIEIGPDTALFGPDAVLNSLELVSVMVDIETTAADEFGQSVSLTDDEAMGRDPVPFVSVSALTEYILEVLSK
jgi:acyl carrier protein